MRSVLTVATRLLVSSLAITLAACGSDTTAPSPALNPAFSPSEAPRAYVTGSGSGRISSQLDAGKCLDVAGAKTDNGAPVILWSCHDGSNQQWSWTGEGELRIYNGSKCLDAWGGAGNNGDKLAIGICNGGANQKWALTEAGELRGINGKCVDLWGSSTADGAAVALYSCHGGTNQKWNAPSMIAGMAPTPAPIAAPAPAPAPDASSGCGAYAHNRLVNVSTTSQLSAALSNAQPGDLILLADGTYQGNWNISRSGTADARIVLCGSRRAVLQRGSLTSGNGIYVSGSYWTFAGFRVTFAQVGIRTAGASYDIIDGVEIDGTGQAGIHMNKFSHHNTVRNSHVHDTGKSIAEYGEGVYIGTYAGQWGSITGGAPDRSDANVITGNRFGPNIGSNHVDVKAGATGTRIENNVIDGAGTDPSQSNWNSAILNNGNDTHIVNNRVSGVREYGAEVWTDVSGWALGTVFSGNTFDLSSSSKSVAIQVYSTSTLRSSTTVGCNNSVVGATLANISCR